LDIAGLGRIEPGKFVPPFAGRPGADRGSGRSAIRERHPTRVLSHSNREPHSNNVTPFHIVGFTEEGSHTLVTLTPEGLRLPSVQSEAKHTTARTLEVFLTNALECWELVHWAPLPPMRSDKAAFENPGFYCAVVTGGAIRSPHLAYVPTDILLSQRQLPWPQQDALEIALARRQRPIERFDCVEQTRTALRWAEHAIVETTGLPSSTSTIFRAARHDYVIRYDTEVEALFFKGGTFRLLDEAKTTEALHRLSPVQFPTTLARDNHLGCWLYKALDGQPLDQQTTDTTIVSAVRALASLQKRTTASSSVRDVLADRQLDGRALFHRVDRVVRQAWSSLSGIGKDARVLAMWEAMNGGIEELCAHADGDGLPLTLVLSDFFAGNVLLSTSGVGFIDVGHSQWSFPYLSLRRFVRDLERRLGHTCGVRSLVEQAFIDEWSTQVDPRQMRRALARLPFLGELFGLLLADIDLDEHEQAVGFALPDGYRARALAPRVEALLVASSAHNL
jgi:hypothetical protein